MRTVAEYDSKGGINLKQMFAALVAAALLAAPAVAKTSHVHSAKVAKAHHAHSMHKTASKPMKHMSMKKKHKKGK